MNFLSTLSEKLQKCVLCNFWDSTSIHCDKFIKLRWPDEKLTALLSMLCVLGLQSLAISFSKFSWEIFDEKTLMELLPSRLDINFYESCQKKFVSNWVQQRDHPFNRRYFWNWCIWSTKQITEIIHLWWGETNYHPEVPR